MSQFFASGGQSIGVSASTPALPMNIQDWFPLGWTFWIFFLSKELSRVFSNTTVQKHQFFGTQLGCPGYWLFCNCTPKLVLAMWLSLKMAVFTSSIQSQVLKMGTHQLSFHHGPATSLPGTRDNRHPILSTPVRRVFERAIFSITHPSSSLFLFPPFICPITFLPSL